MDRAIFIPRRMSSAEVWPACWPTAVPRSSSALGPPKAPPQVRDLAQLDARADDLQQQRATEDADRGWFTRWRSLRPQSRPFPAFPPSRGSSPGYAGLSVFARCSSASARTIAGPRIPTDDAGHTRCLLASRACRRWFKPHTQSDFRQLDATTHECRRQWPGRVAEGRSFG